MDSGSGWVVRESPRIDVHGLREAVQYWGFRKGLQKWILSIECFAEEDLLGCSDVGVYYDGTIRGLECTYLSIIELAKEHGMEIEETIPSEFLDEAAQEAEDYLNDHIADDCHTFGWLENWPSNWGYFPREEHICASAQ